MSKLVIVESPSKAKTIQKYLGKGYEVKSSKGHISDLPKSNLGVDVENNYEPEYVQTKVETIKQLKKALKDKDGLVLAVDPDREGEAIGWHVARELGLLTKSGRKSSKSKQSLERIVFTEITKEAVNNAIKNPRELDFDLIDAQQARRILDRLVGYKLSPLIWKKIRYGLSAGRVQSVALRLIVDREDERDAFDPQEYWSITAYAKAGKSTAKLNIHIDKKDEEKEFKQPKDTIEFKLEKGKFDIKDEKSADKIVKKLTNKPWEVLEVKKSQSEKKAKPPFSTSTLQQTAANKLGFSSSRTMRTAQKLYEAGHITYMRTDSISMSKQAIDSARKFIAKKFGDKFLPKSATGYKTKSKVAQEAHEAIRPTDFSKDELGLKLKADQAKLYELIRGRALASQMVPAKLSNLKITVESNEGSKWHANGQQIIFPGYLKAYPDKVSENELPVLAKGDVVTAKSLLVKQHFTQPPARYSDASLVKEMEKLGIGRPSTYAPTIQTIISRRYVEKESKYFIPTDTGKVVTRLLKQHFPDIVDVGFTADMENKLDKVADGKQDWVEMIDKFFKPFDKNIAKKDKEIDKHDFTVLGKSDEKCPDCGKPMEIKLGKLGRFLSCSDFPNCKGMLSLDEEGNVEAPPEERVKEKEFKDTYLPAPKTEDGVDYVLKKGRYGDFWAHPDYPKVKDAKPLELKPDKIEEMYGKPPKTEDGKDYLLKNGRFGPFWAHPDYPKKKDIISIKKAKQKE